jgi:hypothetical protein
MSALGNIGVHQQKFSILTIKWDAWIMDKPWIESVSPSLGINEALVFANGYLTENCTESYHHNYLVDSLRKSGYKGAIYYLWWDSSNKRNLYGAISQFGIGVLPHFCKHKKRAKRVGKFSFENLIRLEVLESEVSLIGHSLGARVIYYCGIDWSFNHARKLRNVFLLGGAISRNAKWEQVTSHCTGDL